MCKSWGIFLFHEITPLVQTSEIEQILTKTVYLVKPSHIQLNYTLQLFWIIFGENLLKTSLFRFKSGYLRKKLRIILKVSISQQFFIWANPEEYFYLVETTPFLQTSEIGQILTKMFFILKLRHIQINYVFLLFWIIFGENLLKSSNFMQ